MAPSPGEPDRTPWSEERSEGALAAYVDALRTRPLLAVAVVVAALLGTAAWLSVRTPTYTASTQLLITPLPQGDETFLGLSMLRDSGDPTRTMQTAAALIDSPEAARRAARALGRPWTARAVLNAIDVQPKGQSNIVDVTARATDAARVARLANTFAASVVQQRNARVRREVAAAIAQLQAELRRLPSRAAVAADVVGSLTQLERVGRTGDPTVSLARSAAAQPSAVGPSSPLVLFIALFAGMMLAAGTVLLVELISPARLRAAPELVDLHPVPVLARLPSRVLGRERRWKAAAPAPIDAAVVSAFRAMRMQLALQDGEHHVLLFSAASRSDSTPVPILELARTLAAAQEGVLLVDLDFQRPALASSLGVEPGKSLRAVLAHDGRLADGLVPVPGASRISLITVPLDPQPTLVASLQRRLRARLAELLDEARAAATYVLINAGPVLEAGEMLEVMGAVDDVLLVTTLGRTRLDAVAMARDLLVTAGIDVTGWVVIGGAGEPATISAEPSRERARPSEDLQLERP